MIHYSLVKEFALVFEPIDKKILLEIIVGKTRFDTFFTYFENEKELIKKIKMGSGL